MQNVLFASHSEITKPCSQKIQSQKYRRSPAGTVHIFSQHMGLIVACGCNFSVLTSACSLCLVILCSAKTGLRDQKLAASNKTSFIWLRTLSKGAFHFMSAYQVSDRQLSKTNFCMTVMSLCVTVPCLTFRDNVI